MTVIPQILPSSVEQDGSYNGTPETQGAQLGTGYAPYRFQAFAATLRNPTRSWLGHTPNFAR
jgi:hypothetical protein